MIEFIQKYLIYLLSLLLTIYGMSALDFNRIIKKNSVPAAYALYVVICLALAYLVANFLMAVIYNL